MSRQTMIDPHPPESLPDAWKGWRERLSQRKRHVPAWAVLETSKVPLAWGVAALEEGQHDWLAQLARAARGKKCTLDLAGEAESWTRDAGDFPAGAETLPWPLFEALAWAYALPALAEVLEGPQWWKLWRELMHIAAETHPSLDMVGAPLAYQLAAGELPLVLAYQFPELAACRALAPAARDAQSLSLEELLDGEGLTKGVHLRFLRPLMASWTRVLALGRARGEAPWTEEAEGQFRWLVRQALRLTLIDGSQVLDESAAAPSLKSVCELFDTALDLGGDAADRRAAETLFKGKERKTLGKKQGKKIGGKPKLIEPSLHSEWSEVSVLRNDWSADGAALALRHDLPSMLLDLRVAGQPILAGEWQAEVRLNGHALAFEGPWEPVCWQTDADGTYVEFLADLAGGVKLGRQIFLARKDGILFLADAVLAADAEGGHGSNGSSNGAAGPHIEYRARLPLAAVEIESAEKTRELTLLAGRERVRVVPMGLGEWRTDRRWGRLETPPSDNGAARVLELSQHTPGKSLYVPMMFDLKRKRTKTFVTWRQLTVAEQRTILHSDVAVGYRVKFDQEQWFAYRALGQPANRTVLGQNLVSEFLLARFGDDGETTPLVEIEG